MQLTTPLVLPRYSGAPLGRRMVIVAPRLGSAPRSTRVRWHASRGARHAITTLLLLAAASALAPVVLVALGYQPSLFRTDTIAPVIAEGELVVNETRFPDGIVVGDVVTFADAWRDGQTFTEEVVALQAEGTGYTFTTKDALGDTSHSWWVPAEERLTRLAYHVPVLGKAIALVAALVTQPILLLGLVVAFLLASLYRPSTA